MEENNNGITEELIKEILDNVLLILNVEEPEQPTEPVEPIKPVEPENPTPEQEEAYQEAMTQYEQDMEKYNADMIVYNKQMEQYQQDKAEYDYLVELLTFYITAICNNILIRTNRRMFPEQLKYVVVDLVKNKFDSNNTNNIQSSIQSMSEAGRSVNFGVSGVVANKLNLIAQKQLDENEILINRFRLLYRT